VQSLLTLPIITGITVIKAPCPTQYSCIQIEVQMLVGRGFLRMTRGAAEELEEKLLAHLQAADLR
jgi:hypothetical protein